MCENGYLNEAYKYIELISKQINLNPDAYLTQISHAYHVRHQNLVLNVNLKKNKFKFF